MMWGGGTVHPHTHTLRQIVSLSEIYTFVGNFLEV